MNLLHKVVGDLMGQVKSKRVRKPRPRRPRLGSLVERLETRAMLSQVNLGAMIVVPPPGVSAPPVILSTKAPISNVDASVPAGAADKLTATTAGEFGASDIIQSNGQIGVQL
jgi:hypothetical protein